MAVIRWEPIGELNTIQNEMNRLFNSLFDQPGSGGRGSAQSGQRWVPAMDLIETGEHYILRADLPGLSEDDISIVLQDNTLTIAGERKADGEHRDGYARLERSHGAFSRSLTLPQGVDPDRVQAQFDRGVLEVSIPKPDQKKPRQVQIKLGENASGSTVIAGVESMESPLDQSEPVPALA